MYWSLDIFPEVISSLEIDIDETLFIVVYFAVNIRVHLPLLFTE